VRDAEARIAELLAETHTQIMRGGTAAEATASLGLLQSMSGQLEAYRDECARAEGALEEAREAVRARHRETRVVETLRARALLRHKADEAREAARDADDMTLSRIAKPQGETGT
jgi:flagellar export protein FliJ